jgi:hypothetical protein
MSREEINKFFFLKTGIDVGDSINILWPELIQFRENDKEHNLKEYLMPLLYCKNIFPESDLKLGFLNNNPTPEVILRIDREIGIISYDNKNPSETIGYYSVQHTKCNRPGLINPKIIGILSSGIRGMPLEKNVYELTKLPEDIAKAILREECAASAGSLIDYVLSVSNRTEDTSITETEDWNFSYLGLKPKFLDYVYKNLISDEYLPKLMKFTENIRDN